MTQTTKISGRNCLHLSGLLEQTAAMVAKLGTELDHYLCKLNELNSRYAEGRFHLAVLGQFKRGKSTLLNALKFLQQMGFSNVFYLNRSTYHQGGIGVFKASPGKSTAAFFRYEQN